MRKKKIIVEDVIILGKRALKYDDHLIFYEPVEKKQAERKMKAWIVLQELNK